MANRTTRAQVQAQAERLARQLGYRAAYVHAGSLTNGVAWTVTLTTAPLYAAAFDAGQDSQTIRLHKSAAVSWQMLHDMAEGAQMANLRRDEEDDHR